jgi:hypothetical protein
MGIALLFSLLPDTYSEALGFWTLTIVQNSKYKKTQHFGNWICFHPQVRTGTNPVSEMLRFLVLTIPDNGQSPETQ